MNLEEAFRLVREHLSDDLRKPKYRGHPNRYRGQCYVACESIYHLAAKKEGFKPHYIKLGPEDGNETHWVLINTDGVVMDPTAEQFNEDDIHWIYAHPMKSCGFLTQQPSKRAKTLISKVRKAYRDEH